MSAIRSANDQTYALSMSKFYEICQFADRVINSISILFVFAINAIKRPLKVKLVPEN